ncbi:MAG: 6,7-dimethyl-8-ribityllumazine synthase [Candidatus Gygaella obscura]|nr:6,7-dimethyl-8-ribityllumazine synthase [Candidatus Gygaella obscura]
MKKVLQGDLIVKGKKVGIVVSRFNDFFTQKLLDGCIDTLIRHGISESDIEVIWVPGAFEIPQVASLIAKAKKVDAVICLGVIIRGATPHFDYIAGEAAKGISKVSLSSQIPVTFGVVTADNLEQAIERCGTKEGNKGKDAALNAIEMINLLKKIK